MTKIKSEKGAKADDTLNGTLNDTQEGEVGTMTWRELIKGINIFEPFFRTPEKSSIFLREVAKENGIVFSNVPKFQRLLSSRGGRG